MYIEALLKYTKAELSKRLLDAEKQLAESNFKLREYENKIKKLNDKENVIEHVKTKSIEMIVFNKAIGTHIKGPYPNKE